ncbi:hypothetical protein M8J77_018037 [Diaphorina citri]|nr:hypothetical protein M8J77_018037 [Diaphorina citri]
MTLKQVVPQAHHLLEEQCHNFPLPLFNLIREVGLVLVKVELLLQWRIYGTPRNPSWPRPVNPVYQDNRDKKEKSILNVVLPCDDDTQAGSSSSSPSPRRTMSQLSLTIIQPNKRGRSSVSESRAAASVENLRYTKKPKLAQTCEPCISSGGTFKEIQDNRDKKEKSIFLTGGTFKEIQDNRDKKEKSIFLTGDTFYLGFP